MVLFLDRVYGIEDQSFLLHLLEVGFLPDLRAATSLDTVGPFKYRIRQLARASSGIVRLRSCFEPQGSIYAG